MSTIACLEGALRPHLAQVRSLSATAIVKDFLEDGSPSVQKASSVLNLRGADLEPLRTISEPTIEVDPQESLA